MIPLLILNNYSSFIFIYRYLYLYTHTYIFMYIYTNIHIYVYICIYTYICVFMYIFMYYICMYLWNWLPRWHSGKESACQCRRPMQVWVLGWEDPLEKEMAMHSIFFPGEFHGQRSLVGCIQSMGLQRVRHDWACTHL